MKYIKPAVRNSQPLHTVIHRNPGDIPGLVRAPRSGTFVNTSLEQARVECAARSDAWCANVMKYVNGEYGGNEGLKEMWSTNGTLKPLFGAYGERL
jgi:hypothetical protein